MPCHAMPCHAVVTGVFPPLAPGTFLHYSSRIYRVQHSRLSVFHGRRCASNFANSRSRALGLSIINITISMEEFLAGLETTTSTSIVTRLIIEHPGMSTLFLSDLEGVTRFFSFWEKREKVDSHETYTMHDLRWLFEVIPCVYLLYYKLSMQQAENEPA